MTAQARALALAALLAAALLGCSPARDGAAPETGAAAPTTEEAGQGRTPDAPPGDGDEPPGDGDALTGSAARDDNLLSTDQQDMDDDRGWTPQGNTTIAVSSAEAHSGEHALAVRVDPQGPWPDDTRTARAGTLPGRDGVPVEAGAAYRGSLRTMPGGPPAQARCELRWFDEGARILDTVPGTLTAQEPGAWTRHTCAGVAPAGARFASLRVFVEGTDYGDVHYVDDAWLRAGPAGDGGEAAQAPATPPTTPPEQATGDGERARPEPPEGDWPDADSTGVPDGVALTPSEPLTVTEDGAVVEGLDVAGMITVRANDVTIRRTRVRSNGARYGISIAGEARGTVIEDVTIEGTDEDCHIGIVHGAYTVRRADISGCADGLRVGTDTTVEDSYVHDLRWHPGAHTDALQSLGGERIRIVGNRLEGRWRDSTSAIIMGTHNHRLHDIEIAGNLLSGGTYTVYLGEKNEGDPAPSNVRLVDNVWVADSWKYGTHSISETAQIDWSGNRTSDGDPLP